MNIYQEEPTGELSLDYVSEKGYKLISQAEFSKMHGGITYPAIAYLMRTGRIDFTVLPNGFRMIVLSPRTLLYYPVASKSREAKKKLANSSLLLEK